MSFVSPSIERGHFLPRLAEHLNGPWAYEPGPGYVDYLNGPDRERLGCLLTGRNLRVEGLLPQVGRFWQVTHTINVTTAKRPEVIAREIERRLLPAYRVDLAPALEIKAAADSARARTLALCAELNAVVGQGWIRDTDRADRPRLQTSCHYPFRHQVELRFDPGEESVDVQVWRADPALARAIARLIADHPGHPRS